MSVCSTAVRVFAILFWEFVQNVPPLLGLTIAVRLFATRPRWALAVMIAGGVLGSAAIEITEPLIHGQPPSFAFGTGFWVNAIVFGLLGILGVFYLARWQTGWRRDVLVGCALAFLMTSAQALFDGSSLLSFAAHLLAMALTFSIILRSLRWTLAGSSWWSVVLRTLLLDAIGSVIIMAFDYAYLMV